MSSVEEDFLAFSAQMKALEQGIAPPPPPPPAPAAAAASPASAVPPPPPPPSDAPRASGTAASRSAAGPPPAKRARTIGTVASASAVIAPPPPPPSASEYHANIPQSDMAAISKSNPYAAAAAGARTAATSAAADVPPPPADGAGSSSDAARKKIFRAGGGEKWVDETLLDWPEDDHRIFVGDLGNDANDERLAAAFRHYPSFNMARVVRDKLGKCRGFGFVSLQDPHDFIRAMKEMNGKYIGNRPIKLRKSNWADRQESTKRKDNRETFGSWQRSRSKKRSKY